MAKDKQEMREMIEQFIIDADANDTDDFYDAFMDVEDFFRYYCENAGCKVKYFDDMYFDYTVDELKEVHFQSKLKSSSHFGRVATTMLKVLETIL